MANNTGKKYGGREAGTPNKVTQTMREFISNLLMENKKQFKADFKALTARERVEVYCKLLTFVVPKMQSIEFTEEKPMEREMTPEEAKQFSMEVMRELTKCDEVE